MKPLFFLIFAGIILAYLLSPPLVGKITKMSHLSASSKLVQGMVLFYRPALYLMENFAPYERIIAAEMAYLDDAIYLK